MKNMITLSSFSRSTPSFSAKLFLLFLGLFFWSMLTFAQDKGQITSWTLHENPHGVTGSNNTYVAQWEVMRVDTRGGHIRAKLWAGNKPQCNAYADFKWDMFPDVANLSQDEQVKIHITVEGQPGGECRVPIDPYLKVSVMSGTMWDEDLGGTISLDGKDLFGYATSDDAYKRVGIGGLSKSSNDVFIVARDRSGAGYDRDAEDGGFIIRLSWRGNSYDVFYKYRPGANKASGITGEWSGSWSNHTFGTSGSCRFSFSETSSGMVTATGNEGFGKWSGQR